MRAEITFIVAVKGDPDPEHAMLSARAAANAVMSGVPGEGDGFKLANVETFPDEEVSWEVYTMGGGKVLRGGDTWGCRLTYLAEVELR